MSRKIRLTLAALATVALSATACTELTGPEVQEAPNMNHYGSGT